MEWRWGDGDKKWSCDMTSLDEDGQDGKKREFDLSRSPRTSMLTEWATNYRYIQ